jgi:hypothetical protein
VANQRDIIELMEANLDHLKEMNRQQDMELKRWEKLKPLLLRSFRGSMAGKKILLLGRRDSQLEPVKELLSPSGAGVTVILAPDLCEGSDKKEEGPDRIAPEILAGLLDSPGGIMAVAEDLEALGLMLPEAEAGLFEDPPDCCLLFLEGVDLSSGSFFYELWRELHEQGTRVIALFPWQEEALTLPLPGMRPEPNLVDNIDTFWGQMALLKMLAGGAGGHYGFGGGSKGLLPAEIGDDCDGY